MEKLLLDYRFGTDTVGNPDGSFPVTLSGTSSAGAPGNTYIGKLPDALSFDAKGKAVCDVSDLAVNAARWCTHVVFRVTKPVTNRQNLAESTRLPFSMFLTKGKTNNSFNIVGTVKPNSHGWAGPDTAYKQELSTNVWYTASLVYDYDTAALFIDGTLVAVHAFPAGKITPPKKGNIYFGTWTDGARDQFLGELAAFQLFDGIPSALEDQLDERRNHPEWHITYKLESVKKQFNPGERTAGLSTRTAIQAYIQHYANCAIMFHHSLGVAFAMKGAIYAKFRTLSNPDELGYLVTDEVNATKSGGKKSLFSKGGIYWSSATGAAPVLDNIYREYENLGESRVLGFPTKSQRSIAGGLEQEFQGCRMYYRHGAPQAHEVHGSILTRLLAMGGVAKWGYPVTNECDIKNGTSVIGKFSEFETCTIYWSGATGAYEVHGDIRRKYHELGGPLSDLGFPTSNEADIPNYAGAGRANTFQKGSILWYGNYDSVKVARPFRVWIGRIDSKESEGFGMGQNDLYINRLKLTVGSTVKHSSRKPSSGAWGGKNIVDVNYTIPVTVVPNQLNLKATLHIHIKESDPIGGDDEMGKYEHQLTAANAWGLRNNDGIYKVSFSQIKSLTWSVKPEVNIASLSETAKWWGVANRSTPTLTYSQYASAFRGVDSETEWWDVSDWLEKAFYEIAVKGIANGGNCYGMSLEGIYARKGNSQFSMPLNRFTNWNTIRNEVNIKHAYQVGANAIWWVLGQFITGNTHSPVSVFNDTLSAFNRGSHPVICIAQNYDFTGGPHCILPVKWDKSTKPWRITILDPNFPGQEKVLTVNPDNNTFRYVGGRTYTGGQWSGGRFHYAPFSILDSKQRVPIWDLILLLLAGTIIILADDGETVSITDTNGKDLDAFGTRARNIIKGGGDPSEFFMGYTGLQSGIKPGSILVRRELPKTAGLKDIVATPLAGKTLKTLLTASVSRTAQPKAKAAVQLAEGRYAHYVVNNPEMLKKISKAEKTALLKLVNANANRNFIHKIKGSRQGKLDYIVKSGLSEIRLQSTLNANESHTVEVADLATNFCRVKLDAARAKNVDLEIKNKLGVGGDHATIRIKNIPIGPSNQLEFNIKQGIGGIELLNRGGRKDLNVEVVTRINNVATQQVFSVPVETGVRIKPASVLSDRELTVNGIDKLFGRVLSAFRVK
ncbi:LamG-like jellyroll fold domain-containing protein [Parapedobacter soli]|uniref:LamG-like jellyroll fold domain-containing protein n=1 Tax=Parapedobacter soli TaxID=416955 RepID=UPI0021CA36F0|nr:LamG-like jellyroll fold domain-containing protein [Parapedobacter soli]